MEPAAGSGRQREPRSPIPGAPRELTAARWKGFGTDAAREYHYHSGNHAANRLIWHDFCGNELFARTRWRWTIALGESGECACPPPTQRIWPTSRDCARLRSRDAPANSRPAPVHAGREGCPTGGDLFLPSRPGRRLRLPQASAWNDQKCNARFRDSAPMSSCRDADVGVAAAAGVMGCEWRPLASPPRSGRRTISSKLPVPSAPCSRLTSQPESPSASIHGTYSDCRVICLDPMSYE